LIAIAAVLFARGVVIYSATWVINRFVSERVPFRWLHIQFWGGLRGAISLALVLTLPAALGDDREMLTTLTFGVVLFTLFVQGTTIGPLLRRLGIIKDDDSRKEYDLKHARLIALQRSEEYLDEAFRQGQVSTQARDQLKEQVAGEIAALREETRALLKEHPELANAEWETARADMLRAQRSTFLDLRRAGAISEEVFEELALEIDNELEHISEVGLVAPVSESPAPDQSAS
jgi:CPA1 family monovalent cation:H+ antiporter